MVQLTYSQVNRDLLKTMSPPGRLYYTILIIDLLVLAWGIYAWGYQIRTGMGVAGLNNPVGWGVYIATFVFWIGIAHSGTLISAILFLFRVKWRNAVYRTAEAMTVFALVVAGLYPVIHIGRAWLFYWLLPYPQRGHLWINFRSPLIWDVFAVGTYLIVSATFFFTGLVPDVAVVRDQATGLRRKIYGFLAQGWEGTDQQWRHYSHAYLFLAALATPLVISVHSIVSWDFAVSIVPGWHSTIFAPYFVAGAIHSGLAMVLTILIPLRRIFRLETYITRDHLESIAKLLILTTLIMAYSYATEFFIAWYGGNRFEQGTFLYRAVGDYALAFWFMLVFNSIVPLLFAVRDIRRSTFWLFTISILINIGMWCERFVIIIASLAHDYLPFAWRTYRPTWVELSILAGDLALFFFLFLLFAKLLPVVSIVEVKELVPPPQRDVGYRMLDVGKREELPTPNPQLPSSTIRVVGIFAHFDAFLEAIRRLKDLGYRDLTAFSPVPHHEIEEILEKPRSPVRFFTLGGGILGALTGFGLATFTSLHYPLITGGKPIVSIPPFLIIAFELAILFGSLSTILGMLLNIRLPRFRLEPGYDPRFSEDRFGLRVRCLGDQSDMVQQVLETCGAEEVRLEEI